jgi:methionyl-tRNA formyltransferase
MLVAHGGTVMAEPLRIVSFNVLPRAYELVAGWARRRGHRIVLLVTSPHGERYGAGHRELIAALPPEQDVLLTTRMRCTVAPVIAALAPDLIVAGTFPHRIPPEVTAIPRYGAVNLHPAPLPRGRGPNPPRLIYEGDLTVAGTVHRIAPEFDTGPILSQHTRRLPDEVTSEMILAAWGELLVAALDEAVARAVAGEPGIVQDEALATYAAPFSAEERWLCWDEPALTIQRRAAALNMMGSQARAVIDDEPVTVFSVRAQPGLALAAPPGTVLASSGDTLVLRVADGTVEVQICPLLQ